VSGPRGRRGPRGALTEVASVALGVALLVWSLTPVYNIALIALAEDADDVEYSGDLWPSEPSLESFRMVWTQGGQYLDQFWRQFGNSLCVGLSAMAATVTIGALASFAVSRMRPRGAGLVTGAAFLTYVIPASFLVIPFARLMVSYRLVDSLWAIVAADVAFAAPYAMLILSQYARLIPIEVDEAARVDGASPGQVFVRIYVPLMAPALAAVGTYALLVAWNEYLYQYVLLSSRRNWTVAVGIAQFFDTDEAPWNYMMAIGLVYAVPPIAIFYGLRRYIAAGLTLGAIKG